MRTLVEYLHRTVAAAPDRVAVVCRGQEVSYGELWSRVRSAADRLRECGVERDDRVVLAASRTTEFLSGYFGCHLLGAVAVPIDPQVPEVVLGGILDSVRPRALCAMRPPQELRPDCRVLSLSDLAIGDRSPRTDSLDFPSPDWQADLLLTSGTTGIPKGVALTHRNILSAARNINEFIGNTASDREAIALPLNHSFGLGRVRCQMLAGGTVILTGGFLPPKQLFRAIDRWQATVFSFVPSAWAILTKLTGDGLAEFSSRLRYIEIGSAPMPLEEKRRLMRLLPRTRICMHYGLTEASRSAFLEFHGSEDRLDSIGKASPNVRIRIVDPEGKDLPPGQEGMILIGGDHVAGYWSRDGGPLPRAEWVRTGDLGYRAEDGFLYLCGREDDLINVGGRKVHPGEVEEALKRHPSVADCACVAGPDPLGITGQSVKAFLVAATDGGPTPEARELVEFLRGKLEPYKMPAAFEWIAALPRNESGKVSRKKLRSQEPGLA